MNKLPSSLKINISGISFKKASASINPPILFEAKSLKKSYRNKIVIHDISLQVGVGEVIGLLGPNGAGKTTAFYLITGLINPDRGQFFFKGQEISHLPIHQRAKMGMGYLSQEPSVFRQLTVEENLLCILETLPIKAPERANRLKHLLEELHLTPLAKKKALTLSGGETRRLEITRALITEPCFLLLDEPFANIDPIAVHDVKLMIRHLQNKGISILITDHNAREIFSIVNRSYLIQEGRVLLSGTVDDLLKNKEARTNYFGEHFKL